MYLWISIGYIKSPLNFGSQFIHIRSPDPDMDLEVWIQIIRRGGGLFSASAVSKLIHLRPKFKRPEYMAVLCAAAREPCLDKKEINK